MSEATSPSTASTATDSRALPFGKAAALALLCSLFYWGAFPTDPAHDKGGLLAFIAYVPFFFAIRGQTPKRAAQLGLLSGTVMNVGGFYWLLDMLKTFSGFPTALCALFVLIVATYQGGRMALTGWLIRRAELRGYGFQLAATLAFIASEVAFPVLFPWYFGATVHTMPAFLQVADLGGPVLVSLAVFAANLAIYQMLLLRFDPAARIRGVAYAAVPFALSALYGIFQIRRVDAIAAKADRAVVGIVQGNLALIQKREDPAEGLRRHFRISEDLRRKGAEFLVWSESSVTMPIEESLSKRFLRDRVGRNLKIPAVFGGVLYRRDKDRERWFNTAVSTTKEGEIVSRYDKHFLLAFGEYLPFGDDFPILYQWSPNSGRFSKGDNLEPLTLTVGGVERKLSTLICYEDVLPGFTNDAVLTAKDPDILVNITNDAWFGNTSEPWEHFALAKFRAIEHHRYLVRSTNSGVSGVVDPLGRVISLGGMYRAEGLLSEVRFLKGSTLFETIGFWPWYAASLASFVIAFRHLRKRVVAPSKAG